MEASYNFLCTGVVYKIKNVITGTEYVGSTIKSQSRQRGHLSMLKRGTHTNKQLQNDYNIYGAGVFTFMVMLEYRSACQQWCSHVIKIVEQKIILESKNIYNVTSNGSGYGMPPCL